MKCSPEVPGTLRPLLILTALTVAGLAGFSAGVSSFPAPHELGAAEILAARQPLPPVLPVRELAAKPLLGAPWGTLLEVEGILESRPGSDPAAKPEPWLRIESMAGHPLAAPLTLRLSTTMIDPFPYGPGSEEQEASALKEGVRRQLTVYEAGGFQGEPQADSAGDFGFQPELVAVKLHPLEGKN
ncbi:MAG: hypothetical protein JWO82_193 [Akkermansiaceae bacterium]|nr:hypothetical protein [Akkermansiaceae bacterium]